MKTEAAYYYFRVIGRSKDGDMVVTHSYSQLINNDDEMRKARRDYLDYCRTDYKLIDPQITHVVAEPERSPPVTQAYIDSFNP